MTETSKLVFFANVTRDANKLAQLCDRLGNAMVNVSPQVSFPSSWVLEHRHENARVVQFILANCDDHEVITAIAAKEKRQSVLGAIARHPLMNSLEAKAPTGKKSREVSARAFISSPDVFRSYFRGPQAFVEDATLIARKKPNFADQLVKLFLVEGSIDLPGDYISYLCGSQSQGESLFELASCSIEDVVSWARHDVAQEILKYVLDEQGLVYQPGVNAEFATALVKHMEPREFDYEVYDEGTFTPGAVDVLLGSEAGVSLLADQTMSDRQFALFMERAPKSCLVDANSSILGNLKGSRARLEQVLTRFEKEEIEISENSHFEAALNCIESLTDPLFARLLDRLHTNLLVSYALSSFESSLSAKVRSFGGGVIPVGSISAINRRIKSNPHERGFILSFLAKYRSSEMFFACVDEVDGMAQFVMTDPRASEYIYERILESGADEELLVDQLDTATTTNLNKILALGVAIKICQS